jgi:hypothetical protein
MVYLFEKMGSFLMNSDAVLAVRHSNPHGFIVEEAES